MRTNIFNVQNWRRFLVDLLAPFLTDLELKILEELVRNNDKEFNEYDAALGRVFAKLRMLRDIIEETRKTDSSSFVSTPKQENK